MRTLLINTPYPVSEMPQIPMGLAYIAAVLEKAGVEIQVQDFLIQEYSKKKLAQKIHDFRVLIAVNICSNQVLLLPNIAGSAVDTNFTRL